MITAAPRHFDPALEALAPGEIRTLQDRLLEKTMAAVQTNAFFSSVYRSAGARPTRIRTVADLEELPIVRKADIVADVAEHPPYGRRLATPPEKIANVVESSGTSAAGKEIQALSAPDLQRLLDAEKVGFVWAGATEGTVVAFNLPVGMTAAGYWWTLALHQLSCNTLRLGGLTTEQRLHYLQRYGAELMLVDSHYLRRMTYIAGTLGYKLRRDMARMEAIFVGGGGWNDEEAAAWAEEWGVILHEQYGSSQRCISWTCEQGILTGSGRGVVHSLPHQYFLEVVDPESGERVGEGQEGEIVVTLFGYEAMPLIRYGTRDRGRFRPGASCSCGRSFDGIEAGSVRRLDDMVRVRGRNVWPDQVDQATFGTEGVADYRVEIWQDESATERVSLRLLLLPQAQGTQTDIAQDLASRLKSATGLRFEVVPHVMTAREVETSASPEHKPRRWADRRDERAVGPRWEES